MRRGHPQGRPRALVLAPSSGLGGGIERYVGTLASGLSNIGLSVQLLSLHGGRLPLPRSQFVARALDAAIRWRPALVFYMHVDLFPLARAICRLTRAPSLGWVYGGEVFSEHNRSRFAAARRHVGTIATISDYTAAQIHAAAPGADPAAVIRPSLGPCWLDPADDHVYSRTSHPRLVTLTRLGVEIEEKGVPALLRLGEQLRSRFPGFELCVIGGGPALEAITREARRAGHTWCTFTGRLADEEVRRILAESWAFALPSRVDASKGRGEGFGIVYLEAASVGLPVIGSSDGGAAEAVLDGISGFVVDPRDESALLAAATRLLEDVGLRRRMGEAGRRWVRECFSQDRFDRDLRRLVEPLLRRPATAPGPNPLSPPA